MIQQFVSERTLSEYEMDPMLRSAVERQFEIISEALRQASAQDPSLTDRLEDLPRIVAFRNQLIHGYSAIRHDVVWAIVEESLPNLLESISLLMDEHRR